MTAEDTRLLREALRGHYFKPGDSLPGGAFLEEVQSPDGRRMADVVWLGFTRSLGWSIDIHELKTSRADWLRELDDPTKSDAWYPHSSRWWVVVPSDGIVKAEELPDGWGLMVLNPRGRRFKVPVKAGLRDPLVTLDVLIVLAKKLDKARANLAFSLEHAQQRLNAAEARNSELARSRGFLSSGDQDRLNILSKVEAAAGMQVEGWADEYVSAEDFGQAVRRALAEVRAENRVRMDVQHITRQARVIRDAVEHLQQTVRPLLPLVAEPKDGAA
jgi:hypothetical protein